MLRRRFLLGSLVSTALLSTACSGKSLLRHVIVSPEKLQQAVAAHFPRPYPVAGLLQMQLQAPWFSGMAQGQALHLFSELAAETGTRVRIGLPSHWLRFVCVPPSWTVGAVVGDRDADIGVRGLAVPYPHLTLPTIPLL